MLRRWIVDHRGRWARGGSPSQVRVRSWRHRGDSWSWWGFEEADVAVVLIRERDLRGGTAMSVTGLVILWWRATPRVVAVAGRQGGRRPVAAPAILSR